MNPETVHLLARVIRHNREIISAFERWIRSQPESPATGELMQFMQAQRGMWINCERQLSQHVDTESLD